MKSLITIALIATSISMPSCTKQGNAQPQAAPHHGALTGPVSQGGEDDDFPILMLNAYNINGISLGGVHITAIKGLDTVAGVTNSSGLCQLTLTGTGIWAVSQVKPGYDCVNTVITIANPVTALADTMYEGTCQ